MYIEPCYALGERVIKFGVNSECVNLSICSKHFSAADADGSSTIENHNDLKGSKLIEQISFGAGEFADNPEPRCPCMLLLDVSGSMQGAPINELNSGLTLFRDELCADSLAMKRVEVGIVTFGPVRIEMPFIGAESFIAPQLRSQGDTPMGAAIHEALQMVDNRKAEYKRNGISYYRPWIFLITDGGPTDEWRSAAAAVREGDSSKKFAFFAVGVRGANMEVLSQISLREPLSLDGLRFRDMFKWLSSSLKSVSQSTPGVDVALTQPFFGWTAV
jgi:uncharacterized protein YegL